MADVLAGDLERDAARDVPADDVVPKVVQAQRPEPFKVVQLCSLADLGPGLPDTLQVLLWVSVPLPA